jgi:Putative MetA-pathway of phenol degradation
LTGDFARDEAAALSTRDAISGLVLTELARLPLSSPASGFTYRLNPALGTDARSSESFGPFFVQRSLTSGAGQTTVGVSYRWVAFDRIDGQSLTDGTLVATASRQRGETVPFDSETLLLHLESQTVTVSTTYGVTDRLDISAAAPFVTLKLRGERLDSYRGQAFPQASAHATASGLGDMLFVVKYNVLRRGASGIAVGAEATLPTGDEDNLLGA